MHEYRIVEAEPCHVRELFRTMRQEDVDEVRLAGLTERAALWQSWKRSVIRRAAIVDGKVAAIWGCGGPLLSGVGNAWLLTSSQVELLPIAFLKEARIEVRAMLLVYPKLIGHVAASYSTAIRFLKLVGFKFHREVKGFYEMTMER